MTRFPTFRIETHSTRRALLRSSAALGLGWTIARSWHRTASAFAPGLQDDPAKRAILNRFPRMMQDFGLAVFRDFDRERQRRLQGLKTATDAELYIEEMRAKIAESFGPPPERTPLNPRVTGVLQRDGYRVEKILFESRRSFLVSANLYVPEGLEGPLPGVVGTCGHSANGKAAAPYQSFAQGLARQGFVVLILDPIGQGERFQYLTDDLGSSVGPGVREHLMAGNQQDVLGAFIGSWRAWDGIRALDYLLTREEVDPKRVGVTGNSGGGTMTTWLCGLEQRWSMAAPSCFVTTLRHNFENELPADTEQCPPRAIELGLDHGDFLAAMAPKPVIILAKERDYFDVRGSMRTYRQLQRLYRLLDAEENIGLFVGPTAHGFSEENRTAMYGWFQRAADAPGPDTEPELTLEADEDLQCTPEGQVGLEGSKPIYEFNRSIAKQLAEARGFLDPEACRAAVASFLSLPERRPTDRYRILRPLRGRDYPKPHAGVYVVPTEPGVQAVVYRLYDQVHHSRPPAEPERAVLYVSDLSADEELREEPLIRDRAAADDAAFYACDLRGIGESRPNTCGLNSYFTPYGNDYFYATLGVMMGRSYPAQRTLDLLQVLDWLRSIGHGEIELIAKGWGTIPATFAALLTEAPLVSITFKHALTSFSDIAEAVTYDWPRSALPFGILRHFDLPDCYRALGPLGLKQLEPRGASRS